MPVSRRFTGTLFVAAGALAALLACAPAKVVKQWSDPARKGPSYKKLMVMGIWEESRPRRVFEDQFVAQIKAAGADAIPSYRFIPEDGKVSRERVIQAVDEAGVDAVVITKLIGRGELSKVYESDRLQFGAGTVVYESVDSAYAVSWAGFYTPPEVTNETVWTLQSRVFDAKSRSLVWEGLSEVKDPKNLQKGSTELALVVVKELTARGIL